jgi:ABC-type transporter Mla subunit MlaD
MLYNDKGQPVEGAMTAEEVAAKTAEFQTKVDQATKELNEFKETAEGKSIGALREARDKALKDLEDFKTNIVTELGRKQTEDQQKQLEQTIATIAEGDAELAKKIKEIYDGNVKDSDTPEQRQKKLGDAYRLAVGSAPSGDVLRTIGSNAGAPPRINEATGNWPQPLVELAGRLGLSQDDLKNRPYHGR